MSTGGTLQRLFSSILRELGPNDSRESGDTFRASSFADTSSGNDLTVG
jgi:hypothetical protein